MLPIALSLALVGTLGLQDTPKDGAPTKVGVTRRIVARNGETVELRVPVSSGDKGLVTVVALPLAAVAVKNGINQDHYSLDKSGDNRRLFIKLLRKTEGNLDIVLSNGTLLRLYVKPVAPGDVYDGHVEVAMPGANLNRAPASANKTEALAMLRAMRLAEVPAGMTIKQANGETIRELVDIEITALYVYDGVDFIGYVVRLANLSKTHGYEIDLPRFKSPGNICRGARNYLVPPQTYTLLYLVFPKAK